MSTTDGTELLEEHRLRRSRKSRARKVRLGQCPCCGATLAASLAAELMRGDMVCPRRRPR